MEKKTLNWIFALTAIGAVAGIGTYFVIKAVKKRNTSEPKANASGAKSCACGCGGSSNASGGYLGSRDSYVSSRTQRGRARRKLIPQQPQVPTAREVNFAGNDMVMPYAPPSLVALNNARQMYGMA